MVDLTQDFTVNRIDEETNIKEKQRAIELPERRKETLKSDLAIDPAKGFSKGTALAQNTGKGTLRIFRHAFFWAPPQSHYSLHGGAGGASDHDA